MTIAKQQQIRQTAVTDTARTSPWEILQRCGGTHCPPTGCDQSEEDRFLQRRSLGGGGPESIPPSRIGLQRSSRGPKGNSTIARVESRFSHDFSGVRAAPSAGRSMIARGIIDPLDSALWAEADRVAANLSPGHEPLAVQQILDEATAARTMEPLEPMESRNTGETPRVKLRLGSFAPASPLRLLPKLRIGSVDDPLEQEADQIAQRVLDGIIPSTTPTGTHGEVTPSVAVRREGARDPEQVPIAPSVHHKAADGESPRAAPEAPPSVHKALRSSGEPLGAALLAFMEPRFGHDFGDVRVHVDDLAAQSSAAVGAAAYTVGAHISFGAGQYSPISGAGRLLIAHELAHVVQQRQGGGHYLRRQPDFDAALRARDWPRVAEILNGLSADALRAALGKLNRGTIASIHAGAHENPRVGPDSPIANATRAAYLDMNYENELKRNAWTEAARFLNGFNTEDIKDRLDRLGDDHVQKLHDGAVANPAVGDKSNVAYLTAQVLSQRIAPPSASSPASGGCKGTYSKATSFKDLIALVRAAEVKLAAIGISTPKDQIHALRGIYYGTTWSRDYSVERSPTRNEGFQRFTRPSEDPAKSTPPDVQTAFDCGLLKALQDSQDVIDPSGRQVDFGHLVIGLDARSDPALANNIKYPVNPLVSIDMGGTGTEVVTWLGDLGGAAASLALRRVTTPSTSAKVVFTGTDYGGPINLEGDVAGSVVATASPSAVTAPIFNPGRRLSGALDDYLSPSAPSAAWRNRATTFLEMNGAVFDALGALTNRSTLVAAFAKKIQDFACNYLASRVRDKKVTVADAKAAAASRVVSSAEEVATTFVDALDDSHKTAGNIAATRFPAPTSGAASACAMQILGASLVTP
jgi:uncharacterized protein DUF4157